MRTTIELDDDTAAEVQRLRAEERRGVSEAVNELIRRGMLHQQQVEPFVPRTRRLGLKIDVSNIADALEVLEGVDTRSMLVDANILLYSVDESSQFHDDAGAWLTEALNGTRRVALPWISLTAFLRIATNPRASFTPLSPADAWDIVDGWLAAPTAWIPQPGPAHHEVLRRLTIDRDLRAGLVTDAVLAALCIEHGLDIVSADSDFARFGELTWINPVAR